MGFFAPDEASKEAAPRQARASRAERTLDPSQRGCDACSLRQNWSWIASPQMAISGNTKDPDVLALGEAPGEQEDRDGIAFVGDSGRMLRSVVPGRELDRLAFQNTVRCRPRDNATPSVRDTHACSLHLEADIERYPFKAILGIGSVPLSQFFPGASITRIHGARFPVQIGSKTLWYWPVLHPSYILRTGGERSSAAYPILRSDVKRLFQELDSWPKPTIFQPQAEDVLIPRSLEEAVEIEAAMEGPRGVDLETTGLRFAVKDALLLTAAISDGNLTMSFPIHHPEAPTSWGLQFLLDIVSKRRWIAHNAAFELVWMMGQAQRANIAFEPMPFDDSMALGRIYHERETLLRLDTMSRLILGTDFKSIVKVNRANMINEPLSRILPYNGLDAQASVLIWRALHKQIENNINYKRLLETVSSQAHMELMGLDVNEPVNESLKQAWDLQATAAAERARSIYEVREYERVYQSEFNIDSADHVGRALVEFGRVTLPKTNKGEGKQWSTDDQDLRNAAPDNPLVLATLDRREATKMASTYIDSVRRDVEANIDRRIHPAYTSMLTATGRPSSEAPNIQNFPKRRHRELRRQIVPPKGHVFLGFDYGQIEARCFCFATRDRNLCKSTIAGFDIHSHWLKRALELHPPYIERLAQKTNESEEAKILKGARDIIKTDFVFASFFGSNAGACAERTGIPLVITQELLAEFWSEGRGYPEVLAWIKAKRREYADTGSARLLTGMVRHGIMGGNEPINTPIQGTSTGHLVLDAQNAMSRLSQEMKDPYLHPRVNIHDDLIFIVPDEPDLIEAYIDVIAPELVAIRYDWQIVPLMVEARIGHNWADLEAITTHVGPYLR